MIESEARAIFYASATYKTSNILIPKVVKFGFRAFTVYWQQKVPQFCKQKHVFRKNRKCMI